MNSKLIGIYANGPSWPPVPVSMLRPVRAWAMQPAWKFAGGWEPPDRSPATSAKMQVKRIERKVVALLAEDNRVDVMLIREAIETHGLAIELHVVNDGEQACDFIEAADTDPDAACPELLILDLNLPRRSGIEILERLRSSQKCNGIPVLIVTSSDLSREQDELAKLGVLRHFRKPTGYDEYLKIGEVLDQILKESHLT